MELAKPKAKQGEKKPKTKHGPSLRNGPSYKDYRLEVVWGSVGEPKHFSFNSIQITDRK